MSNLALDKIKTLDGSQEVDINTVARGSAKGWINFDGTGSVSVRNSLNVSSLVDQAVGEYRVNWTNAFAADYASVCDAQSGQGSEDDSRTRNITSTYTDYINHMAANPWRVDTSLFMATVHGDLA